MKNTKKYRKMYMKYCREKEAEPIHRGEFQEYVLAGKAVFSRNSSQRTPGTLACPVTTPHSLSEAQVTPEDRSKGVTGTITCYH